MNTFESGGKLRAWLPALLACAIGWAPSAWAAATPAFSATASGTASSLTVVGNVGVGDADLGHSGNFYLAADTGAGLYFNNGSSWVLWSSGPLPVYATGALASRSLDVVSNTDLSFLGGTQIYLGYGLSESDMINNSKFGLVYTVPSALQQSDIDNINTALSSGMNAIAAAYNTQSTFSSSFSGTSVSTSCAPDGSYCRVTIALSDQVACPAGGRITYSGNIVTEATTSNATIQGLIAFYVGDPTNNLNDCNVGNGVILDGNMTLSVAGSATAGVGFSLTGTITTNQRGPTGGLIPTGGGRVFLNLPRGGTRVTGSIFGTPVY